MKSPQVAVNKERPTLRHIFIFSMNLRYVKVL